jgi:hypothetical protein
MKINGAIEINGIDTVVFYRKNVFERINTGNGGCYWKDLERGKSISDNKMMSIIKDMTNNPFRRVWVHYDSINVVRV